MNTIAVAWKGTPEAARALTAAMPLLMKARRVDILVADESDSAAQCLDCSEHITQHLRWHGVDAHAHFVLPAGRSVAKAVTETAKGFGADLLVMGAYGHSRLREFVFGGFTKEILAGVDIPVFLLH
jgi:nucleotide-binding universal stress UspA family protein